MKKLLLSTISLASVAASSALAADLPSTSYRPVATPAPLWTGFYAGLNAGGNIGTNSNINSQFFQNTNTKILDTTGANTFSSLTNATSSMPFPNTGNSQSGFIGGGQLGYNYQISNKFILGVETDFQGTSIRGSQNIIDALSGETSGLIIQNGGSGFNASYKQSSIMNNSVNVGVDYIGTLRGRLGYTITPEILVYGTGGFTYGGVRASIMTGAAQNTILSTNLGPYPSASQIYSSNNQSTSLLTGYSAGGGIEWKLLPNISVKLEAIYWNMGTVNYSITSLAAPGLSNPLGGGRYKSNPGVNIISGNINVNYQGIIARAGVNYHFNFANVAPVVAKF